MFNYPFYTNPSYYTAGMGNGLLGGSSAGGLLRGITSKWSWNGFLTSTGKTLNVINQAIPIFYQVRPIVRNARTMFRVLGAVKDTPNHTTSNSSRTSSVQNSTNQSESSATNRNQTNDVISNEPTLTQDGSPTFFL